MFKQKNILAIIPARGGSKGLPGKNVKPLLGKPLIAWSIEQAKNSKYIDEIFVSTDSQEIADVSREFGIQVPFLRPKELASDTSPSSEFVLHTINYYRSRKIEFDYILLLEPTSPLRKKNDIDNAIKLLDSDKSSIGVVSLGEVHTEHPGLIKCINNGGEIVPYINSTENITHRQNLNKVYFPYGVVYLVNRKYFEEKKIFYSENSTPYFIERWQNYEVDDLIDFLCVETIFNYKKNILV